LLILASGSPQRRELLEEAGYYFQVWAPRPEAECGVCSGESPQQMVCRLARQKAADAAGQLAADSTAAAIVACDTVAVCGGQVLGKPSDIEHARRMLNLLRGRDHEVISGLCVWPLASGVPRVELARTRLHMDDLSSEAIEEYLESGQWEGKAGAFGYQDRIGWLRIVEGSPSNVIGLPLELLEQILKETLGAAGRAKNAGDSHR
jgi:septum formation protein